MSRDGADSPAASPAQEGPVPPTSAAQTGPSLTERELAALASAGSWYANYHARIIAEQADVESAYAVARRERYDDLLAALRKLGVRVAPLEDGTHAAGRLRARPPKRS